MGNSSVIIDRIVEGTYFEAMTNFLRHGDKCPIPVQHMEAVARVERAKNAWLQYKQDTTCVNLLAAEYKVSRAQAYNYLADAKAIYCLQVSFNYFSELLIEKERIERLLAKAEKGDNVFAKRIDKLIERRIDILQLLEAESNKGMTDNGKKYIFIYHNDWTKVPGLTPELYHQWQQDFDELEIKAKQKFSHLSLDDERAAS